MTAPRDRSRLLRPQSHDGHARVTFVELFFDLVFVFAITQLSHLLLHHLSLGGALQTGLLLVAIWWVWVYTSWVTNWLDPDTNPVRLLLFGLMIAGLLLAAAIPQAFGERAHWFALIYVAMQIGRSLYMMWALSGHSPANYRNFQRITIWLCVSGALWIAGGFLPSARLGLWTLAMVIESAGPASGFATPGLGRSTTEDWKIAGGHLAERCGLFVIIALGESLLLTGATFAEMAWTLPAFGGLLVCVIGTIAMWWVYFNIGAERGSQLMTGSADPGAMGRLAYTYIHIVIVAGIIVCAVSDEIILKHPDHGGLAERAAIVGGPALFLLGCLLFKWATAGWAPLSHISGIVLLAALFWLGGSLAPIWLGACVVAIQVLVAVWETVSLRGVSEGLKHGAHAPHG